MRTGLPIHCHASSYAADHEYYKTYFYTKWKDGESFSKE
jgi:hypothetical protein